MAQLYIKANELEEKDIDVFIDTLNQCLQNTNAQVNISKLLKKIPLNKLSKEHIVTILAILDQCSKTDKARANTA